MAVTTIPLLPPATAITGAEQVEVVQNGTSVRTTALAISGLAPGPQGPAGVKGDTGATGPTGPTGPQGSPGVINSVAMSGGTTGLTVSGSPITTASGTFTLAGTLAVANGGTGVTTSTGTGNTVLSTSPSLTTPSLTSPNLGTPTFANLINATGMLDAFQIALSDMTTALTTGTLVAGWVIPYNLTIVEVFTGLTAAQSSSGIVTTDMKLAGTTVFSTKPSVGANQNTSLSGAGSVAAVLSTTSATKGQIVTFNIDAAGTGAKGLIVTITVRNV